MAKNKKISLQVNPVLTFFVAIIPISLSLFCLFCFRMGKVPEDVSAKHHTEGTFFFCFPQQLAPKQTETGDLVLYTKDKKPSLFHEYVYVVGIYVCGEGEQPRETDLQGDWEYDSSWGSRLDGEELYYRVPDDWVDSNPLIDYDEYSEESILMDKGIVPDGYICVTTGENTIGLIPADTIWGFPSTN